MKEEFAALYDRIRSFPLDEPDSELKFSRRLARENGWSQDYADRVVLEYRKFAFLAVAAGHPVTPSDAVDQAWHLHLTHTRSYWDRFCKEALGRPLHHEPTRGGTKERAKFAAQYDQTLKTYQELLGHAAPSDIWPEARIRFGDDLCFTRVNVRRRVVLSRGMALAWCFILILALGIACSAIFAPSSAGWTLILAIVGGLQVRRMQLQPDDMPLPTEMALDPYEMAFLAGGERRAVNAAIASLVSKDHLVPIATHHRFVRKEPPVEVTHPLERQIYQSAGPDLGTEPADLQRMAQRACAPIKKNLTDLGLLVAPNRTRLGRAAPIALVLLAWCVATAKYAGNGSDGSVEWLYFPLLLVIGGFATEFHRSPRGDRTLSQLRRKHRLLILKSQQSESTLSGQDVPTCAALFGLGALLGDRRFEWIKEGLKPPQAEATEDDSGCGTGCDAGCGG